MASAPIFINGLRLEVGQGGISGSIGPASAPRLSLNAKTFLPLVAKVVARIYTVYVPYTAPSGWADRQQLLTWALNTVAANAVYTFLDEFGAGSSVYIPSITYPTLITPQQDGPDALYSSQIQIYPRL